jgi:8-oxo-dGTP pyrophosphatase MutT (NUDIX family)
MSGLGRARSSTLLDAALRIAYRFGFPIARAWWRVSRPRHEGAIVAVYVDHALMLVRTSYRSEWSLPGGGVHRGETPEAAARRELIEELGLVTPPLQSVGSAHGRWDGQRDHVHFFELRLDRLPELRFDNREVVDARLVSAAELRCLPLTGPTTAYFATVAPPS